MNSISSVNLTSSLEKPRLIWVDVVRIICVLMVIAIHFCAPFTNQPPGKIPNVFWGGTYFCDQYFRCAVPLFIMISGTLALRKKNIFDRFGYRLFRILFALVIWSFVYLIIQSFVSGTDSAGNKLTFYFMVQCILAGDVALHLWFLYMFFTLYLCAPILQAVVRSKEPVVLRYFIGLWFFAVCVWPMLSQILCSLFSIEKVNFSFPVVGLFAGYFVAGYYYGKFIVTGRMFAMLLLITLFLASLRTYTTFWGGRVFPGMEVLYALLLFLMLKYLGERIQEKRMPILEKILQSMSSLSFGIYLIHMLVLYAFERGIYGYNLSISTFPPCFSIPIGVLTIFFVSSGVTYCIQKTPFIRWIIP